MKKILTICSILVVYQTYSQPIRSAQLSDTPRIFAPGIISTGDYEFNASFSPNNKTVYFSKTTSGWDYIAIFYATFKNGKWIVPQPVPFTGIYRDTDPFVSPRWQKALFHAEQTTRW